MRRQMKHLSCRLHERGQFDGPVSKLCIRRLVAASKITTNVTQLTFPAVMGRLGLYMRSTTNPASDGKGDYESAAIFNTSSTRPYTQCTAL